MKYDIKAPSHDGPEEYVRKVRVHHNTIEHLVLFLPGLWLFSFAVDPIWAFIIGIVWPIGRIKYALDYYKDAEKKRSWFIFQYATNIYLCSWIINWFYYKNRFVKEFLNDLWGILGTGNMAKTFASAIKETDRSTLLAVGSRSKDSADLFASTYNCIGFDNYQKLLDDKDINSIYLLLIHHILNFLIRH